MTEGNGGDRPATEGSAAPAPASAIVVVPRQPGPIVRPRPPGPHTPDELDEVIEDVFGPTTDERPGRLDVVLLVGGGALVMWAWLGGAATIVLILGIFLVVLGLALPARTMLGLYHQRRRDAVLRREAAEGYPLDASDPSVADLVVAYEHVRAAADGSSSELAEPAVVAAHLAVVEAAVLLEGRPPIGRADRRYVDERTAAMNGIAERLAATPRRRGSHQVDRRAASRDAAVAVRRDLESATGLGAMPRMERLQERLGQATRPEPER